MSVRKRIDISTSEFPWVVGAIFLLGSLSGWALFGRPYLACKILSTNGSAEVLGAAIGAGIAVIGAIYVNGEKNKREQTSVATLIRKACEPILSELESLQHFMDHLQYQHLVPTINATLLRIKQGEARISRINDSIARLPTASIGALIDLEIELEVITQELQSCSTGFQGSPLPQGLRFRHVFGGLSPRSRSEIIERLLSRI